MKINSELERVLLEEQTKSQKAKVSPNNSVAKKFGSFFENELGTANSTQAQTNSSSDIAQTKTFSDPLTLSADRLATGAKTSTVPRGEAHVVESLNSGIQNMVEEMDTYASSLQNSASLKQAWASLDSMNQNIGAMQKDYAKLSSPNSSMGSMLNSLEVLTVTETYKFNRGDYS